MCSSSFPATLLFGDLSDGLHLQPSLIIVSAILGPTSPLFDQVDESRTPYLIYSPCSISKTCLANTSAVTRLVYNSLYTQKLLSKSTAIQRTHAGLEYPQSQVLNLNQLLGISKGVATCVATLKSGNDEFSNAPQSPSKNCFFWTSGKEDSIIR